MLLLSHTGMVMGWPRQAEQASMCWGSRRCACCCWRWQRRQQGLDLVCMQLLDQRLGNDHVRGVWMTILFACRMAWRLMTSKKPQRQGYGMQCLPRRTWQVKSKHASHPHGYQCAAFTTMHSSAHFALGNLSQFHTVAKTMSMCREAAACQHLSTWPWRHACLHLTDL